MRSDVLAKTLAEIEARWIYNRIMPNVVPSGGRRWDEVPWNGLAVFGDLGAVEGHQCEVYDPVEGCVSDGHDNYQLVAWIDYMGEAHYLPAAVSGEAEKGKQ